MRLRRTTAAPSTYPLTLAEAKQHLRVDQAADDSYISDLVIAASDMVQDMTWTSCYEQVWQLVLPHFPGFGAPLSEAIVPAGTLAIRLPRGPVTTLTSITYIDADGDSTVLSSGAYQSSRSEDDYLVAPIRNTTWPEVECGHLEGVVIQYTAGYDGTNLAYPPQLRQAVRMLAAHWYENRETVLVGTISKELELAVQQLCRNMSRFRF